VAKIDKVALFLQLFSGPCSCTATNDSIL